MMVVGVLLLLCSSVGVAVMLVKEEERNVDCVGALLELLLFVRDSVDIYAMSAGEILCKCGELLKRCGYPDNSPPPDSFDALAKNCFISDKESKSAFEDFSVSFGKSYRAQEVQKCEYCIERLRVRSTELEKRLPLKRKMILSISVCASLALLILLL